MAKTNKHGEDIPYYLSVQYLNMFLSTEVVTILRNSFLLYIMHEIQEDTIVLDPGFLTPQIVLGRFLYMIYPPCNLHFRFLVNRAFFVAGEMFEA